MTKVVVSIRGKEEEVITSGLPLSAKVERAVSNSQTRETRALLGDEKSRLGKLVDSQRKITRRAIAQAEERCGDCPEEFFLSAQELADREAFRSLE